MYLFIIGQCNKHKSGKEDPEVNLSHPQAKVNDQGHHDLVIDQIIQEGPGQDLELDAQRRNPAEGDQDQNQEAEGHQRLRVIGQDQDLKAEGQNQGHTNQGPQESLHGPKGRGNLDPDLGLLNILVLSLAFQY